MVGQGENAMLRFREGADWFFSAHDPAIIRAMIDGILKDPDIRWGMRVGEVRIQPLPQFSSRQRFALGSPVLIKRNVEGARYQQFFTFKDPEADELLTETFQSKLRDAGIDDPEARIAFDPDYQRPKVKLVEYKGVKNKASLCPVIVTGSPEAVALAWCAGAGSSTGIGMGGLE